MANKKKKEQNPYKRAALVESLKRTVALLKSTLKDVHRLGRHFTGRRARLGHRRDAKGSLQDIRSGIAHLLARPVRTSLALVTTIGMAAVCFFFLVGNEGRFNEQLEQANTCLESRDYENAVVHYENAMKLGNVDDPVVYLNYLAAIVGTGDEKKATEVLSRLAPGPGNSPGIKQIHRLVAFDFSNRLANSIAVELRHFKWHLDHSGDVDSIELNVAWARYYLAVRLPQKAVSFFQAAAIGDARYFAQVLDCHRELGQKNLADIAAKDARPKIENLVKMNPKDESSRILLSRILYQLGAEEDCEQLLLTGLELAGSRLMKAACADFYLAYYRQNAKSNSFSDNLGLLQKAFLFSPDIEGAPTELNRLYQSTSSSEEKAAIITVLKEATENKDLAIRAHSLLGAILFGENRNAEARDHVERSYELDPTNPVSANNLAVQLCELETPDLERALSLSRFAVETWPENASMRGTLGDVLIKLNQHQSATIEFEKALALKINNAAMVHEKLAICYDELGFKELSQRHAANSKGGSKENYP